MNYIKNGVYPITEAQIRTNHPNTSFPQAMTEAHVASFGYSPVTTSTPVYDPLTQQVTEAAPSFIGGVWTQQWTISARDASSIIASLTAAVQQHLDDTARARGYDGILSACTYATDTHPPFQSEGQACVTWRGSVWSACYAIMAQVQAGTHAMPTAASLIAELPAMVWPT